MQNKIKARPNFKSNMVDNPFELLKAIEEHSSSYQENQYNMLVILDAIKTLFATKQKDGATLQDYTKRFRIAKKVLEFHIGGPIILIKIVKTIPRYTEFLIVDFKQTKKSQT